MCVDDRLEQLLLGICFRSIVKKFVRIQIVESPILARSLLSPKADSWIFIIFLSRSQARSQEGA